MDKSKLETLNKKRVSLHEDYRKIVIERNQILKEYTEQMSGIGVQIQEIDMELRRLKTPIGME